MTLFRHDERVPPSRPSGLGAGFALGAVASLAVLAVLGLALLASP